MNENHRNPVENTVNLSPSSLSFLVECPACFCNKILHNICQPTFPLAYLISTVNSLVAEYFKDRRTEEFDFDIPPGTFKGSEMYIRSKSNLIPENNLAWYINGRIDTLIEFDDGSYGIIDFKTSRARAHVEKYSRQLHAYNYAFNHPESKKDFLPISKLGLIYVNPKRIDDENGELPIGWDMEYVEIEKDEDEFLNFIDDCLDLLTSDKEPKHKEDCRWGEYVKTLA